MRGILLALTVASFSANASRPRESLSALLQNPPPGAPVPPSLPPQDGILFLDRTVAAIIAKAAHGATLAAK